MSRKPVPQKVPRLRQRIRKDGNWRVWWEPEAAVRELGFEPVELDGNKPTWSARQACELNARVRQVRSGSASPAASPTRRHGKTVADLIAAYRRQPKWTGKLAAATRRDYNAAFKAIETKWGDHQVRDFSVAVCLEWYNTLYTAAGPYQAASLIRKFSVLFTLAKRMEWRGDNPCSDLGIVKPAPRTRVLDWAELDQLQASAVAIGLPSMAAAITIAAFMGQRQTDIRLARVQDFTDTHWLLVRSKRRNHGAIRIHEEARPLIERLKADAPGPDSLLITKTSGIPYTADSFPKDFALVRAHAARRMPSLATMQFRDLRRSFGHLARMGGAEPRDVGDALGNSAWTDPEIGGTYMPSTEATASRAVAAVKRPGKTA